MSNPSVGRMIKREIDAFVITLVKKGVITLEEYQDTRDDYLQHCEEEEK